MKKEIICTVCPRGCHIQVEGNEKEVLSLEGYGCKRGVTYATAEYTNPVRILTTTVKVEGKENELLPVRSSMPVPKDKLFACMEVIKQTTASAPIKRYDFIVKDICGTGVDIVATKDIE
jgi:CxxC motif-containing protein